MPRSSNEAQLAKIQKQLVELQKKQQEILARSNSKVLAQIVALAKKHGLSATDIAEALKAGKGGKDARAKPKKPKSSGGKVAPKYRNPANPDQTWTGRGKSPLWAQELRNNNALESALIQTLA